MSTRKLRASFSIRQSSVASSDREQKGKEQTVAQDAEDAVDEEEEQPENYYGGYGEQKKIHEYQISNPDSAEDEVPFQLVTIEQESEGCTPAQLRDLLGLPEAAIPILMHFYDVKEESRFSYAQLRAISWQFGFELVSKKVAELEPQPRPPIITIMGHVDHGKTTLLDCYRNSNLTEGEVGGITQKIGGFMVETQFGKLSFIDTPGHSLFTNMRRTGANCTDIIILVISAIEGVQSQTHEVLSIIEENKIPVVIALNKIDSDKADPEAVEEDLFKMGVEIEPLGGNVPVVHISAVNKINTNLLLELLIFEGQRLDIKSIIGKSMQAFVLEGKHVDSKNCTLIIRQGKLRRGDIIIAATSYCKVMKIMDDRSQTLEEAVAGMAVQVVGFKTLPKANERVLVVSSEREAKDFIKLRDYLETVEEARNIQQSIVEENKVKFKNKREKRKFYSGKKEIIEQKYASMLEEMILKRDEMKEKGEDIAEIEEKIEKQVAAIDKLKNGDKSVMKIILKANDYGTLDTMVTHILNIKDSSGNRNFEIVKADVGPLSENDLIECLEFEAKIYVMDVNSPGDIEQMVKQEGIDLRKFKIIYQMLEDIDRFNESLNETYAGINVLGRSSIKEIFDIKVNQSKTVRAYGLTVDDGLLNKAKRLRLIRNKKIIYDNMKLAGLRHFKKEVNEVKAPSECGLSFIDVYEIIKGDIIECYEPKED